MRSFGAIGRRLHCPAVVGLKPQAMPPKPKVIERGDLGLGITYEVRPAAKGSPTVHVVIDGQRLPPF
jgi:hypothetical protein